MNTPSSLKPAMLLPNQKPALACADVVFNLPIRQAFTYGIPAHFDGMVKKGMRVFVPFGKRRLTGYVVSLSNQNEKSIKLKSVEEVPDTEPVISEELLSFTRWISSYYQSSWGEAIKAALPAGLDDTSLYKLSLTGKGVQALSSSSQSSAADQILQTLHLKKSLTSKQLERALEENYNPRALAKLKLNGLVKSEIKIKRSSLSYKYEKFISLAKNLPTKEEIDKLLKRCSKQRAAYERLCRVKNTSAILAKEFPASSDIIKNLRLKGLIKTFVKKKEKKTRSRRVRCAVDG